MTTRPRREGDITSHWPKDCLGDLRTTSQSPLRQSVLSQWYRQTLPTWRSAQRGAERSGGARSWRRQAQIACFGKAHSAGALSSAVFPARHGHRVSDASAESIVLIAAPPTTPCRQHKPHRPLLLAWRSSAAACV